MSCRWALRWRAVAGAIGVALAAACARVPIGGGPDSGALWAIVSRCVDRDTSGFCACGPFRRSCCGDRTTPDADVVWARTRAFVAIRDLEMCGCPPGFVAGLALPRARVTGIEDPRRPEGIWPFAWGVARTRIPDERQIGLAINPKDARSENQMHVHLLRLRPETRAWLDTRDSAPPGGTIVLTLPTLDAVFAAAEGRVGAARMADTGILVARARDGGWRAAITYRGSPQAFTVNGCRSGAGGARARGQPRSTVMRFTAASKPLSMRLPAGSNRSSAPSACAATSGVTSSSLGTACSAMRAARLTIGP